MHKLPVGRRQFLSAGAAVGLGAAVDAAIVRHPRDPLLRPTKLRTAQVENPLGLDFATPTLSWQLEGNTDASQRGYRVRVASSRQALAADRPDLWDSGAILSENGVSASYSGKKLGSRQRCFWDVTVWLQDGTRSTSDVAYWEMGLLAPDDWTARWIAADTSDNLKLAQRGGTWVTAPIPKGGRRAFRLAFESKAGDAQIILQAQGKLRNVTIDGATLTLPPYSDLAFGSAPPVSFRIPLPAGSHILALELEPQMGNPSLAAQVGLLGDKWVASGWQTAIDPADGWRTAGALGTGWEKAAELTPQPSFALPPGPARMLRRGFRLEQSNARSARLYVTALGGYEAWLNGRRIGDDTLQPEPCDYADHIPYRVYDVAPLLRTGENVIAVMVADGFYASYTSPTGRYSYGPPPRRLLLQLEVDDAAGARTTIATGEGWRSTSAPLLTSEIYNGEDWDNRLQQDGWTEPGFNDSAWERTPLASPPPGKVIPRILPPIRQIRALTPQSIRRAAPGRHIVDFGQNFSGRVRLRIKGQSGDGISVRHAEILDAKGELDRRNLRAARDADTYILRGDADGELLEARFSYRGFRYAEVEGPADLKPDAITGVVLSSSLEETGLLRIGEPLVQKLWLNTLWSQRSNFVGLPTDCPQRDERLGWSGDAQVFWDTAAFNMDVGEFTRVYMTDMRDAQGADGAFPIWAPNADPDRFSPQEPTPGWSDAGVMLPYIAYQRYGDRRVIDENWDAMTRYVEGVLAHNPDGLWKTRRGPDFSDWLALDAKYPGDETTPKTLVATAMLARSIAQLAQMAEWTGRQNEARRWRAQRAAIGDKFATAFIASDGRIGNGSHTSYILALAVDLVPAAFRARAAALLVAEIHRRGTLLTTGFLGTPLALDVLADTGHVALAYELLLRTDYPSWGYMVRKGATTIWERWNGDTGDVTMNSFNHYALGSVCGFLYRRAAGLSPVEPGFARALIAPLPDPRIGSARCEYRSVRGRFAVDWRLTGTRLALDVTIPPTSIAEIRLPAAAGVRIAEGGVDVRRRASLRVLRRTSEALHLEAGPGDYAFLVA